MLLLMHIYYGFFIYVTNWLSKGDDDGDGIPDHLDNDDDGDGIPDNDEGFFKWWYWRLNSCLR